MGFYMKHLNLFMLCAALIKFSLPSVAVAETANCNDKEAINSNSKVYYYMDLGIGLPLAKVPSDYNKKHFHSSAILGLGLGYQVNDKFRTSIQLRYFNNFNYMSSETEDYSQSAGYPEPIDFKYTQKLKSAELNLNAAYEFIKKDRLSIYMNGGIGIARNQAGNFDMTTFSNNTQNTNLLEFFYPKAIKYDFTWNVGAGLSFALNENVTFDLLNYSYCNLGRFSTKDGYSKSFPTDPDAASIKTKKVKLAVNTITTGIRIKF